MANITLNIDNSLIPRIQDAFGVTSAAELKQALVKYIKAEVAGHEARQTALVQEDIVRQARVAADDAIIAVETQAKSEIVVT
jgi:hypothetical protein